MLVYLCKMCIAQQELFFSDVSKQSTTFLEKLDIPTYILIAIDAMLCFIFYFIFLFLTYNTERFSSTESLQDNKTLAQIRNISCQKGVF